MPFDKFKSIFGRGEDKAGKHPPVRPPVTPPGSPKDAQPDGTIQAGPPKSDAGKADAATSAATTLPPGTPPTGKDSPTEPVKPAPAPAAPAKAEEKPAMKPPTEEIPDVKTLKLERSGSKEEPNPAVKSMPPPAETKGQPGKPTADATGDAAKKTPGHGPPATDAAKGGPAPSPAAAKLETPAPALARTPLLADAHAPAGLLAPPKKPDEPASVPAAKPAEPAGPKPAQFQNLPAADAWCPATIAEHYPELRAHVYEDCVATERVLAGGWRVVGATKRGRQHAHKATHREDAIAFNAGAQFTILAVSDGAGSCPLSRLGSHVASRTVTARLMEQLPKLDKAVTEDAAKLKTELAAQLTAALVAACQALQDLAAKTKTSAKDYRCTLLTVLHWRGAKHELLLANQIGDGAILVLNQDKSTRRIGEADSGQFSGEVSCFVPDDNARDKAKKVDFITPVESVECVLLCTDGIEDPFFPIAKQAEALFRQLYLGVTEPLKDFKAQPAQPPILSQEVAAGALGQWLEFEKRGENDDRSVLLLHRRPPTVTF